MDTEGTQGWCVRWIVGLWGGRVQGRAPDSGMRQCGAAAAMRRRSQAIWAQDLPHQLLLPPLLLFMCRGRPSLGFHSWSTAGLYMRTCVCACKRTNTHTHTHTRIHRDEHETLADVPTRRLMKKRSSWPLAIVRAYASCACACACASLILAPSHRPCVCCACSSRSRQ